MFNNDGSQNPENWLCFSILWRIQYILAPIFKKGDLLFSHNYRSIALLDLPFKIYTSIPLAGVAQWIEHQPAN